MTLICSRNDKDNMMQQDAWGKRLESDIDGKELGLAL